MNALDPLIAKKVGGSVGQTMSRLEAWEKACGAAVYTGDMVLPGLLHGAVLTSPHAHARIRGYDLTAALAVPGVKAIITGDDFEDRYMGLCVKDETVLARHKVRYIGEIVAVSIHAWFREAHNITLLDRLRAAGLNFTQRTVTAASDKLKGTTWVITGTLSEDRETIADTIRDP